MKSLHFNYTEIWRHCKTMRRSQNKEISFPFFAGSSPDPSTENMIVRKFLCFVCRVERGIEARIESPRTRMRTLKYKATTRSARCNHRLFSKWVRVKASISSQNETSSLDNERAEGAREEVRAKISRRFATNWDGTGAPKHADLSLFRI